MTDNILRGGCHCGALEIEMHTALATGRLPVRACQCTFCRHHGAVSTADPAGHVIFRVREPDQLSTYRFALKLADYLVCRRCGVYVGALMPNSANDSAGGSTGALAVVSVNSLAERAQFVAPQAMDYEGESTEQRVKRRRERWMPARIEMAARRAPGGAA